MLLKDYLAERGITLSEMALLIGATQPDGSPNPSKVYRHAHGIHKPSFETIERYRIATNDSVRAEDWVQLHKQMADKKPGKSKRAATPN